MREFFKTTKSEKGAALLIILGLFAIVIPLMQGVWKDSQLEYQFSRYKIDELQARYNAKSSIGLGILRIYVFKGLEKSIDAEWRSSLLPVLDKIWSFPFAWPIPFSEDMPESERQDLKDLNHLAFLRGSYVTDIQAEDGRVDINNLSSPVKSLRDFTYDTLLHLLIQSRDKSSKLQEKYENQDFVNILNNLSDWTDSDNESQNGGSEELLEEGKSPLNRYFVSVEEIQKTPGLSPEIFEILEPHISVYGSQGLNINYTSKPLLEALGIPSAYADELLARTEPYSPYYKPFSNLESFCSFISGLGLALCESLLENYNTQDLLRFDAPMAFRIKSSGEYRGRVVNMETLIYDLDSSALNYQKLLYDIQKREREGGSDSSDNPLENPGKKAQISKPGPSKIDYSDYTSLTIMYLKED